MHITRELLRAVSRGDLPPRLLARLGLEHLTALCPHCAREVEVWRRDALGEGPGLRMDLVVPLLATAAPELTRAEERAERDLADLLALPDGARQALVARARTRFRGPILVRLVLNTAWERLHSDSAEAYQLASLALAIADRSAGAFELHALAAAAMGNACRVQGDLRTADRHFEYVRFLLDTQDITDPAVLAEIVDLEGSLRKDQRQFGRAEDLLLRALALYQVSGLHQRRAKVTVLLADVHFYRGDTELAIRTVGTALALLRRGGEPSLYLGARHNLASYLTAIEQYQEAAELLAEDEDLFAAHARPTERIRRRWLLGLIALGSGRLAEAEEALLESRDAFLEQGVGFLAAMVSMDLADIYLRTGRPGEVRVLAEAMVTIFQAQDVHREALAALALFQEAARREAVTLALVERLRGYLRDAIADRELKFHPAD